MTFIFQAMYAVSIRKKNRRNFLRNTSCVLVFVGLIYLTRAFAVRDRLGASGRTELFRKSVPLKNNGKISEKKFLTPMLPGGNISPCAFGSGRPRGTAREGRREP